MRELRMSAGVSRVPIESNKTSRLPSIWAVAISMTPRDVSSLFSHIWRYYLSQPGLTDISTLLADAIWQLYAGP